MHCKSLDNEFELITDFNKIMFVTASSSDTDSINISYDSDTSSSESFSEFEYTKTSAKQTKIRPSTATSRQYGEKNNSRDGEQSNKDVDKDSFDGTNRMYKKEHTINITKCKLEKHFMIIIFK